jgi:hypothetical protein
MVDISKKKRNKAKANVPPASASAKNTPARSTGTTASPKAFAEMRFVADLIARHEAARLENGHLPPGATHEIVDGADDEPVVVRRRFSAA